MKLELKHLAPYLPYGLKAVIRLKEDSSLPIYNDDVVNVSCFEVAYLDSEYEEFKPILNPLSAFEKVIAKDLMIKFSTSLEVIQEIWQLIQGDKKLEDITLKTYEVMCNNHIDFNGLINNGLAIDKNKLATEGRRF